MRTVPSWILTTTIVTCIGVPRAASAQLAPGLAKQDPATTGKTDIAKEGFASAAAPASAPEAAKDATELSIGAGGLLTSGNSRTLALTASAKGRLRRDKHQGSAAAAFNYGRAGKVGGPPVDTTVENIQGLARYDYFVFPLTTVLAQTSARRDRFQGLDLRLNVDPGVSRYFLDDRKQRFWGELGYDFQYDIRRDASIAGTTLSKTNSTHSARVFAGYDNKLYKEVAFTTGIEYLQSVQDSERFRINFDAGLKSSIAESLSVSVTFTLRYDNQPLPNVEKTDTITAVNLVYAVY